MARGPDGALLTEELDRETSGLNRLEFDLAHGLEKVIDDVMKKHRPGDPFVYGIGQSISPRMSEALSARYRAAGWSEARISQHATGACLLVLTP